MIELSLEMCNDIANIINSEQKDDDNTESIQRQFYDKYNVNLDYLQNIINDEIEKDYIENKIYHIVPIVTIASFILNGIIYLYLQKITPI